MVSTDARTPAEEGATRAFLDDLVARGREPLLHGVEATVEFEVVDERAGRPATEKHLLRIDDGVVSRVAGPDGGVDAVIRAGRDVFDAMASGRANPTAAMLRGAVVVEGDPGVVGSVFRVFPGPPGSRREGQSR